MSKKIKQVNEHGPVVTELTIASRTPSPLRMWEQAGRARPANFDVDHILDPRLGSANLLENLRLLHRSVNRSFGAQISNAIEHGGIHVNTPIRVTVFK